MNPLSIRKYFANNVKKIIGQVISLALGVSIIYFIFAIGGGFLEVISKTTEAPLKNKVLIMPSKESNSMEKLEECHRELIKNNEVKKVIKLEYSYSSMKTIMGKIGCDVYGMGKEDIGYFINNENYKLIDGRLPENNDELIASEAYAKSNGYKINDYIGNEVKDSEQLIGKKKIVGIYSGDKITACYLNENISNYGYFVLLNNSDQVEKISDKYEDMVRVINVNSNSLFLESLRSSFKFFGLIIIGVMILIEGIIINNIMYLNLLSRKEELALLHAIGQSDKRIKNMILAQQRTIIFIGYVLGNFIGIIGMIFFNSVYLEGIGQKFSIFNPWYLLGGSILSLIIILTSTLPIKKFFKKVDRVSILEGS
jgi:ABC-type antimicrobial peptide transport system permease subunit